jgi:hypothetical protein
MRLHFCSYSKVFLLHPLLWLGAAISILVGCSKLAVDDPILPNTPLPKFELLTDSAGLATLNLDSLASGRPFTITFGTFKHGRIELDAGSNKLRYTATDTSHTWAADSGLYTFCQANQCRDGQIKVRNIRYRNDTIIVDPEPTDTCVALPLRRFHVEEAATKRISLGFTSGDTGTLVVSNIAYNLWQEGSQRSTSFYYIASGGPQTYYSGFDEITYSGTVQGRRVCGTIEVVVGDSCEPRAKPDFIPRAQLGPTTILPADLLRNDSACNGERANFKLRLRPTVYLGALRVATRLGTISDTTIGGSQALVYRRYAGPTAGVDSFFYYTENRITEFVTRATVSLP